MYELYDQYTQALLCILEINLAIASISLPALPQLIRRVQRGSRQPHMAVVLEPTPDADLNRSPSDESSSKNSAGKNPAHAKKKRRTAVSQMIYGMYSEWRGSAMRSERAPNTENTIPEAESSGNRPDEHVAEAGTVVWHGGDETLATQTIRGQSDD